MSIHALSGNYIPSRNPRLTQRNPAVRDRNRDNLRPLDGQQVIVYGQMGYDGGNVNERNTDPQLQPRKVRGPALVFPYNDEQARAEGFRANIQDAQYATDHATLELIRHDPRYPNFREKPAEGQPLVGTAIAKAYKDNTRMGATETQHILPLDYLRKKLIESNANYAAQTLSEEAFQNAIDTYRAQILAMQEANLLMYDAPQATVNRILDNIADMQDSFIPPQEILNKQNTNFSEEALEGVQYTPNQHIINATPRPVKIQAIQNTRKIPQITRL